MPSTLSESGLLWAELDENGLLTGNLMAQPTYDSSGRVRDGWRYVGDITASEFANDLQWEQHRERHSRGKPNRLCHYCQRNGWL